MRTSLQLGGVQSNSVTNAKCPQLSLKAVWAPDTLQSDQPRPQTEDKAPKTELKLSRTGIRDEKKGVDKNERREQNQSRTLQKSEDRALKLEKLS